MKNTEQIIMENIDLHYREYSRGEVEDIKMLMRKYAEEAIEEAKIVSSIDTDYDMTLDQLQLKLQDPNA